MPHVSRGRGRLRADRRAPAVERLTTGQLIALVSREGFHCTRRIIDHSVAIGMVPRPTKLGNWRRWDRVHADALRRYLAEYSRSQTGSLNGGDACA